MNWLHVLLWMLLGGSIALNVVSLVLLYQATRSLRETRKLIDGMFERLSHR